MMLYKPTLKVEKLVVYREKNIVYEQEFTSGINIIRGENSSGKSSVLNFIFFGLGGDFKGWTKEASLCDWVYLHLCINGESNLVVRRRVEKKGSQPMEIYYGDFLHDKTGKLILDSTKWKRFSFRRSEKSPSFSQILFQHLDFPEVRGEASSNITMHQLLRLIYAEQSNVPQKIFRFEQHDSPLVRQTVGGFLEGVYDDELYNYILNKNEKEKEFEIIDGQLKSFYKIFGASTGDLSITNLEKQESEWIEKAEKLQKEISETGVCDNTENQEGREELNVLREEMRDTNSAMERVTRQLRSLEFEIEDSGRFISELAERLKFLSESNSAAEIFKGIQFSHCPACLSELGDVPEGCCAICGKEERKENENLLRMKNEISMQIRESRLLQDIRAKEAEEFRSQLKMIEDKKETLDIKYKSMLNGWISDRDLTLNSKYSNLGYAIKAIEDVNEKKRMSGVLVRLQEDKARLSELINELKDIIKQKESHKEKLVQIVHREVKDKLITLLRKDLPRQDSFIDAEEIDFSYQDNLIRVNGTDYFSASSMVYLNKCFRLALFWSSGKIKEMRFPRIILLDGIEDGGIEPERAHNFQRLVKYVSNDMDVEHQIIMATSVIDEDLDKPDFVRGEFYTHDKRTLSLP